MPKNLSALLKLHFRFFLIIAFFVTGNGLTAQEFRLDIIRDNIRWYKSNSSGMMLELIPSRLAAIPNEYCLSVRSAAFREIPELLLSHYNSSYSIELRILYKEGKESRYQWNFRDPGGLTRLTASGQGFLFSERGVENRNRGIPNEFDTEEAEEEKSGGIIEIKNSEGAVIREFRYDEDQAEWDYQYFYRGTTLLRTEVWFKESPLPPPVEENPEKEENSSEDVSASEEEKDDPVEIAIPKAQPVERAEPVFERLVTDHFRYSRSGSLRAIDRTFHGGAFEILRVGFPRLGPGASSSSIEDLVSQGSAYSAEYFAGARNPEEVTVNYNLDNRGRILGEVWKGEDGVVLAELKNTWSGDRLLSSLWKTEDDERLIEFEYNKDGNRTIERNFRRGVLERSVTNQDDREIEEIYMNGRVVLRAYWENGVKISEERVLPNRENPR
jgi:hypothetical protein